MKNKPDAPKKNDAICAHCGGLKEIRNPTGLCDHLYWPEMLSELAKIDNGYRLVKKAVWEKP